MVRHRAVVPPPIPPDVFQMAGRGQASGEQMTGTLTLEEQLQCHDDGEERLLFARRAYLLAEVGLIAPA